MFQLFESAFEVGQAVGLREEAEHSKLFDSGRFKRDASNDRCRAALVEGRRKSRGIVLTAKKLSRKMV